MAKNTLTLATNGERQSDDSRARFLFLWSFPSQTDEDIAGSILIDIREFYGNEDDLKPGKKGISLSADQVRHSSFRSRKRRLTQSTVVGAQSKRVDDRATYQESMKLMKRIFMTRIFILFLEFFPLFLVNKAASHSGINLAGLS